MSRKRLINLAVIIVGLGLIGYAIRSWKKIQDAKGMEQDTSNFFNHNPSVWDPLVTFFGGQAQEAVSKYDLPVLIIFASGITLTVGGVMFLIRSLQKSGFGKNPKS